MEVPSDVSRTCLLIGGLKLPVRYSRPLKVAHTCQLVKGSNENISFELIKRHKIGNVSNLCK